MLQNARVSIHKCASSWMYSMLMVPNTQLLRKNAIASHLMDIKIRIKVIPSARVPLRSRASLGQALASYAQDL